MELDLDAVIVTVVASEITEMYACNPLVRVVGQLVFLLTSIYDLIVECSTSF